MTVRHPTIDRSQRREFLRRSALAALAFTTGACSSPRRPASESTVFSHLEQLIRPLMSETKVPGVAIAIIRDAHLVWSRGFGVKDRSTNEPVDDHTVFEAASMSKPLFAYAVLKLCERGILDLDTPLTKYTSERILKDDPRLDLITARHVLAHTSGLQDIRSGDKPLAIHFQPGARWLYSGEGYAYLQSAVTNLTGLTDQTACGRFEADLEVCATDLDLYLRANLLGPFGMNGSDYLSTAAMEHHFARPHDNDGDPLPQNPGSPGRQRANVARYGAMGGLLTTARDYAKFLIEVIDPKPPDACRLTRASLSEMFRPQIKVEDGDGYSVWWGLGWRVARTKEGDLIGHGGDQTGFHSTSEFSLADKSGFVILTNGDNGWQLIRQVAPGLSKLLHA